MFGDKKNTYMCYERTSLLLYKYRKKYVRFIGLGPDLTSLMYRFDLRKGIHFGQFLCLMICQQ